MRVPAPEPTALASAWACPGVTGAPRRWLVISAETRCWKSAPSTATPAATPIWRIVFTAPVAMPARELSTVARAACDVDALAAPSPTPAMMKPASSAVHRESPLRWAAIHMPTAARARLPPTVNRGGTRSASRATIGAAAKEATVSGRTGPPHEVRQRV